MSTVIQYKYDQKPNQQILVENETKNHFSSVTAMDMIGLTWIFKDEDLFADLK